MSPPSCLTNNIFKHKVPAGIFLGNAFGKMVGYPQVKELGNIENPYRIDQHFKFGERH